MKTIFSFVFLTFLLSLSSLAWTETYGPHQKNTRVRGVVDSVSLPFGEFIVILNDKAGGKRKKIIRGAIPITDGHKDVAMMELIPGESVTLVENPLGEVVEVQVKPTPTERENKDPAFDQTYK